MKAMRKRGIREGLVERIEEILGETSRVRIGGQVGEGFWMARGIRQSCPLSPMLCNLLIADLEEEMESKMGRGKIRRGKNIFMVICRRYSVRSGR